MASRLSRATAAVVIGLSLGAGTFVAVCATFPTIRESDALQVSSSDFLSAASRRWRSKGLDTKFLEPPRILFVGDIMLDRGVAARSHASGDPAHPFRKLPTGWFEEFDFAVANLEGPVTRVRRLPEKSMDFAFDPSMAAVLKGVGIDAVSLANNHALDQGTEGFEDSRIGLRDSGVLVFGHGVRDDIAYAMATATIRDVRFGFVGFNTSDHALDRTAAARSLAQAKSSADRVIVFMHWGEEYKKHPDPAVAALARWLIDQGADMVIGSHPHWSQGIESYQGRPIVYSLGNFIFDQDFSEETKQGLAVAVTFRERDARMELIPIHIDLSQPRVVEGDERVGRLKTLAEISSEELHPQILAGMLVF